MIVLGIILALIGFFHGVEHSDHRRHHLGRRRCSFVHPRCYRARSGRTKSLVLINTARVAEKAVPDLFGDRVPLFLCSN